MGKGKEKQNDLSELDENFLALWAKHIEPKLEAKNKEFQEDVKQVVGMHVKTEVDRVEKS